MDYCGLFQGGSFLVIIDAKSKWLEVLRMSSTTAEATINAYPALTHRVRYTWSPRGEELVTDNGAQFSAQEVKDFLRSNKIKHILSAPYHPASNGEAKRAVKNFQAIDESCQRRSWNPKSEDNIILATLLHHSTHHYRMYTSRIANESQTTHQIRSATPDLRRKVAKPSSMHPRAPRRQLNIGNPVLN